ncbi:MAG: peptidoglycan DD-metalloendopeptidase family protein [Wenzhouxiangellaceae bacterium]
MPRKTTILQSLHHHRRNLSQYAWHPLRRAPRLAATGLLLIVAGALLGAMRSEPAAARQIVMDLSLPPASQALNTTAVNLEPAFESAPEWQTITVQQGDTLGSIFKQQQLSANLLHRIVHLDEETRKLTRIMPGQQLFLRWDEQQRFAALKIEQQDDRWLIVEADAQGELSRKQEQRSLQRDLRLVAGDIETSFYLAGKNAGLSDALILKMANIFGWDIDFVLDIRAGDRFYVLYEEIRRDGEFLRDGEVLAATFINQDETFQAVQFDAGNGPDYFSPDGRPMRKAFLRAPLNFLSVNSGFNPRRMHPVLKTVRPHNGIDYGAPVGTPVYATGDGTVIASAYNNLNGHYVFVKHPNNIVTKYLHFSRRAVNKGQRVRQGQTIGYLGGTGRVTGAHLHYEFVVNGVHRNPRTVKLPKAEPVPAARLAEFKLSATPLLKQLERLYGDDDRMLLAQNQ